VLISFFEKSKIRHVFLTKATTKFEKEQFVRNLSRSCCVFPNKNTFGNKILKRRKYSKKLSNFFRKKGQKNTFEVSDHLFLVPKLIFS